jgi:hypothetical protein
MHAFALIAGSVPGVQAMAPGGQFSAQRPHRTHTDGSIAGRDAKMRRATRISGCGMPAKP